MTVTSARSVRQSGRRADQARLPLSRSSRRAILVAHIISAGGWIGVDVIVAVLVLTGWFADDVTVRSLAYQALATFVVCADAGLRFGVSAHRPPARPRQPRTECSGTGGSRSSSALNVLLCTVMVVVLQPGMGDVASYGRELLTGSPAADRVSRLFFPPAVSLCALTFAVVLAVFKPSGRIRPRHAR